jgi:hypothetical protein
MSMAKRRYTDEFRANATLMLEAAGYPDAIGAMTRVANHLGVPRSTLKGWYDFTRNPPPPEMRREKKLDLIQAIKDEISAILGDMPNARMDAQYRELATAFGILVDKLQLLSGEPTERTETKTISEAEKHERIRAIIAEYGDQPPTRLIQ